MLKTIFYGIALVGSLATQTAFADWKSDPNESNLYFTFVKSEKFGATGEFSDFTTVITEKGHGKVTVNLSSLITGIDKRDSRLRDIFFNTEKNPTATVNFFISPDQHKKLRIGRPIDIETYFTVTLNDKSLRMKEQLTVTKMNSKKIYVQSAKPVLLRVDQFNLSPQLQKLIDLAGVQSISYTVPVSFKLKLDHVKS